MANMKKSCKAVWDILKVQYEPRAKIIENTLKATNSKALKEWKKRSYCAKIRIIDNLQSKGVFDKKWQN